MPSVNGSRPSIEEQPGAAVIGTMVAFLTIGGVLLAVAVPLAIGGFGLAWAGVALVLAAWTDVASESVKELRRRRRDAAGRTK